MHSNGTTIIHRAIGAHMSPYTETVFGPVIAVRGARRCLRGKANPTASRWAAGRQAVDERTWPIRM